MTSWIAILGLGFNTLSIILISKGCIKQAEKVRVLEKEVAALQMKITKAEVKSDETV